MSYMPDMTPKLRVTAVPHRTGKFIKMCFERGENLQQNGIITLCV